jgi:ribosomal protein L16 Arg81 hydroxylase
LRLTYDPLQLELADELPFPDRMPDDAQVIEVGPGGILFLPRGWWHQTEADGECLQVNFVMNRPMWVDVLTRGLRERLIRDVEWRATAFDVFGCGVRREASLAAFADLIAGLGEAIAEADPASLAAELIASAGLYPVERGSDGG